MQGARPDVVIVDEVARYQETGELDPILTPAERRELAEYRDVVTRGVKVFYKIGEALAAIRDRRLYRETHGTFEEFCRAEWGFNASRARQLMIAAETVTNVTAAGLPAPANEGQARELARVPEEQRAEVWQKVVDITDGQPTAAAIRRENPTRPPSPPAVPAPRTVRDPFSLPESVPSEEVHPVSPSAVLDREEFLEERARKEAAEHARRASDDLRRIITYCAEGLASPPLREQYVRIYEPPGPDVRERVPVNADNIDAAADALREFARLWRATRETAEEQH